MTAAPAGPDDPSGRPQADLAGLLAGAPAEVWGRAVMAVAVMHEPDDAGRCRHCRPGRRGWRWWRRHTESCPTRRMLLAEVTAVAPRVAPCCR